VTVGVPLRCAGCSPHTYSWLMLCPVPAVHTPYDKAPGDPTGNVYRGMLWRSDWFVGSLVDTLKAKGMYANTLIVYS
jgi:hypothetical protein